MIQGHQSWIFQSKPVILGCSAVGGPFEAKGALAQEFDLLHEDIWLGQDSFEKAEKKLLEEACNMAIKNSKVKKEDINFFISGDLMNQITSSSFSARTLKIPYLGIFGACSSSMEGLAISSFIIDSNGAEYVLCGTSSHNAAAEKQFRYPTEYGGQKPPTAQWTVTGAGAAVVGRGYDKPKVTSATIGKVVDMGISDPFNMGAAMAPAAVDTIEAHFRDLNRDPSYYDIVATGDLGKIGHEIAKKMLKKDGFEFPQGVFTDCGILMYKKDQPVFSGASGCACSATVTYGHFLKQMSRKKISKILVVATGALMSPMSYQQKESIPCVAHGVSIEA
ncbi:stage V sporulation protein AD [Clostridium luticellarii]|uniref:Stage V sporulation protein AD n=1 Tax=Clostridium luticellarii TaxID=1691940 RepID=A0A2T0BCG0_9CLOT|nr:stage V sporulation protein AD [Clostridium luticellarii]MCI1944146.1 stage V sporulation protein AD [Clostridium luticellarii]MCI1967648.1 stage V sporulation protein AD [Clostridium luticellarii]MCI1996350.1 stage V sporulation protein AD [Clostridium luticellarii]MCI2039957.1 stage V sporulation protein AD [Clostridium luticellarii]PRR81590.1 Stage V sporulation protein AD [Clostridium luticellarii]